MRHIDTIVIHMSLTPPSMDIGAAEIDRWHRDRGWRGIGYHHVIRRDGTVEDGRPIEQQGAHVAGHNSTSIGVCMVGGRTQTGNAVDANFTSAQWRSLSRLCKDLLIRFPDVRIVGHRDLDNRGCPGFDAIEWSRTL